MDSHRKRSTLHRLSLAWPFESTRYTTECRVPDYAAWFNVRPVLSALTGWLTRHKSYGPSNLASLPDKEEHREHHTRDS
jgi:hypothetical protein